MAVRRDRLKSAYPQFARHPRLTGVGIFLFFVLLLVLTMGWWLKPVLEWRASVALGREVTITSLNVDLIPLRITGQGIAIANPAEFPEESQFGSIERLQVRLRPIPLLIGRLSMPELIVDKPKGDLRTGPSGKANWILNEDETVSDEPFRLPDIGRLIIRDGDFRFADPKRKADVRAIVRTQERKNGEDMLLADIKGRYAGEPLTIRFRGGAVLAIAERNSPYPVNLDASSGDTRIKLSGTLDNPSILDGGRLKLELQGKDMSKLYPLIGIPLAPTPPYRLAGRLDYHGGSYRFTDLKGTVGQSDLSGKLVVDPGKNRPMVMADLMSRRVVLADLGGFIGTTPGEVDTPNQSPEQKAQHRREEARPRFLPDKPLNIPEIRAADFKVSYKGQRIEDESTPLDNLEAKLEITNGRITLRPLKFGIGDGDIRANITVNASETPVHTTADVLFRRVDMSRIMESTGIFEGAGRIGGRAKIDTTGKSLAEMLGRGNGELQLFMTGGQVSSLLVNLAGLDFGNSLLSLLQLPPNTKIRCMVSDFGMQKGLLQTRSMIFDTSAANVLGKGTVNLANEMVDYEITTEPKKFSVGSLAAPIEIKGPLKDPSIGPDAGALAVRAAPAIALGALLTPLAALLPTIQLGLGDDNDCVKLIRQHRPRDVKRVRR